MLVLFDEVVLISTYHFFLKHKLEKYQNFHLKNAILWAIIMLYYIGAFMFSCCCHRLIRTFPGRSCFPTAGLILTAGNEKESNSNSTIKKRSETSNWVAENSKCCDWENIEIRYSGQRLHVFFKSSFFRGNEYFSRGSNLTLQISDLQAGFLRASMVAFFVSEFSSDRHSRRNQLLQTMSHPNLEMNLYASEALCL